VQVNVLGEVKMSGIVWVLVEVVVGYIFEIDALEVVVSVVG
jgi:hypothetical protein